MVCWTAGQETSARRSPSKVEATQAQAPSAQESNPRGKKGSKFAQIKAQEAARKAARTAASGLAQASGQIRCVDVETKTALQGLWRGTLIPKQSKQHQKLRAVDMLPICFYAWCANLKGEQQCNKLLVPGAEASSAADGVDTAVGEATEVARTGSSTKTQSKSQDPKVKVDAIYSCIYNACMDLCTEGVHA